MRKITFLTTMLFLAFNLVIAQDSDQEKNVLELSQLSENTKNKNYAEGYKYLQSFLQRNPKYSLAIYSNGEKILKGLIKSSAGAEKTKYVNELTSLWKTRAENFASKTPKGKYLAKAAKFYYDNNDVLNKTDQELYDNFDTAYKTDVKTFTNPTELYTYFKLAVKLFDAKKMPAAELFTKYDEVSEKVESEVKNYTNKLNKFKADNNLTGGEEDEAILANLSGKSKKRMKSYNSFLKAYDQIAGGMDADLGNRANCENLIPLYEGNFESNKNDPVWLQRAMNRLYAKECTTSDLFVKIVEQKNTIQPDAGTAYYLGILKDRAGNASEAESFYKQAIALEEDNLDKAKILMRLGAKYKKASKYSKARGYYRQALKANPSLGKAHLAIAQMYAKSVNNCGNDVFEKKMAYYAAINEASRGARLDPKIKKAVGKSIASWKARTPSKSEIFSSGKGGQSIALKCWVGGSVKVPNL